MREVGSCVSILGFQFCSITFKRQYFMSAMCPRRPPLLRGDLTPGEGCALHFFDRQPNFHTRRRILICSDPGSGGWVACGGGLMETRKAHQNAPNKCGGELHHRPPGRFTSQTEARGVVKQEAPVKMASELLLFRDQGCKNHIRGGLMSS